MLTTSYYSARAEESRLYPDSVRNSRQSWEVGELPCDGDEAVSYRDYISHGHASWMAQDVEECKELVRSSFIKDTLDPPRDGKQVATGWDGDITPVSITYLLPEGGQLPEEFEARYACAIAIHFYC